MSWKEAYFHIVCMLCSARAVMGFDDTVNTISAHVDFGESAKLECNLIGPNNLNQVTWTKIVGNKEITVATYTKSEAKISKEYEKRLNISISNLNKTTITVFKASVDDEGCYTCVFNVFPTGSQRGKVCLSISGDVLIEKQHKARLGEAVTLRCLLRTQSNVRQVSWQKNGKNIATYNTVQGTFSVSEHENILKMTMLGLNNTAVTIGASRVIDEGDYHCLFNSFPSGSSEGKTTLHVYEPLNVTLFTDKSKDFLNITCVARARPLPLISWSGVGQGYSTGSSSDGTLTVTSWIVINAADSQLTKMMQCRVLYSGKETLFNVPEIKNHKTRVQPTIIAMVGAIWWCLWWR